MRIPEALPLFDPATKCCKCGVSNTIDTLKHEPLGWWPWGKHREVLERQCCHCGHYWLELPLDVEESSDDPR